MFGGLSADVRRNPTKLIIADDELFLPSFASLAAGKRESNHAYLTLR